MNPVAPPPSASPRPTALLEALRIRTTLFGESNPGVATILGELGKASKGQGDTAAAEGYLTRQLALLDSVESEVAWSGRGVGQRTAELHRCLCSLRALAKERNDKAGLAEFNRRIAVLKPAGGDSNGADDSVGGGGGGGSGGGGSGGSGSGGGGGSRSRSNSGTAGDSHGEATGPDGTGNDAQLNAVVQRILEQRSSTLNRWPSP